jgi:hypothetical protein
MSLRDTYRVRVTAIITGWAEYNIPEGDKIRHFVDGSSEVEWDLSTVRDFEYHEAEFEYTYGDEDCDNECGIEDKDGPDARAPYPLVDAETEEAAPDNDDGPPF